MRKGICLMRRLLLSALPNCFRNRHLDVVRAGGVASTKFRISYAKKVLTPSRKESS